VIAPVRQTKEHPSHISPEAGQHLVQLPVCRLHP
jgi:hypothetical protein